MITSLVGSQMIFSVAILAMSIVLDVLKQADIYARKVEAELL